MSSADQLERDVTAWVDRARATYRLDCQAMDDLWQAYCGTDFEPNDPDAEDYPKQVAARLQDQMQAAMKPVLAELPALDARVKPLLAKKETRSRGETLAAQLDKQRKRLQRLSVQDVWRGANDPIRFQAAEYGKQRHRDKYDEFKCKVPLGADKEARFPVSGPNKPDCIVPDKCQIWEFKPDSPKGHEEGEKKKRIYADVVPAYYNEMYKKKEPPPTELGGAEVMKTLVEKCLEGDHIVLDTEVDYYKMCDKRYECVGD
jgi:hypothetical protein